MQSELGGGRILRIDGVRTIAILLVFAFHTGFLNYGWMGVHLFFVLSGFLITGILRREREQPSFWGPFYIKRAARILPPLVIIFLAAATVYYSHIAWHSVALLDIFFLGNIAQTLYPHSDANLGVLWSLAVEEHFYLLWPFAIRFLDRRRVMQILIAILLLEPVLRGLITPFTASHGPVYYLTPFQLDGLAAGSLLALLFEQPSNFAPLKKWSGWTALVSFLALSILYRYPFFTMDANTPLFNSIGYSLIVLLSASFIVFVLLRPDAWIVRRLSHPWVVFIGSISYGMYLFNPLMLDLAIVPARHLGNVHDKLMVPLGLALTIAMSWLSFRFYEQPIIQWGRRKAREHSERNRPLPPSPIAELPPA